MEQQSPPPPSPRQPSPATPLAAVRIRRATAADVPLLLSLIRALAAYERAEDAVRADEARLLAEGFGPRPAFEALLAEIAGEAVGFALYFHSFSTWEGRKGLYVEDLFVTEAARGRGVGRRLLAACAAIARKRGCARLDLAVLDWNPARAFYERLGFEAMQTWLPHRLSGAALERLAAEGT